MSRRLHIEVTGTVQGVGFRPHCHALAQRLGLSGWIYNHSGGVSLEIQGDKLEDFVSSLQASPPPMAQIDGISRRAIAIVPSESGFRIRPSQSNTASSLMPADSSVCDHCLAELFNPNSRYFRYPFLNCSHCGPRHTICSGLPYDRQHTSMASFKLCPACQSAYDNPADRRFHAQPTACDRCGPQLSMNPEQIVSHLENGKILAIKGLGGYHLVCDARNDAAVTTLRQRKGRKAKPLAIMAANCQSLEQWVALGESQKKLLSSPQRPIVLGKIKNSAPNQTELSKCLAPGLNQLGVMLPYTPLHYLIFNTAMGAANGLDWLNQAAPMALVMTSANVAGEPLIIDDEKAEQQLADIADHCVTHNRPILSRCDDSLMATSKNGPYFVRRARSYVPQRIKLSREIPSTLALGGYLKNTICVTRGDEAFVSQHIGDLKNRSTIAYFEQTVEHLLDILDVKPQRIAHDLHPDFYSSQFAQQLALPTIAVQHHHAHLAAVAAEHKIDTPAIGLALDGFGLGDDQQSWGGELMLIEGPNYHRLGHFAAMPQPGGDVAAAEPWRMAAAVYQQLGLGEEIQSRFSQYPAASHMQSLLEKGTHCTHTSSAGRLFDAAAALLGVQEINHFEGQAAMMLESLVTQPCVMADAWQINQGVLDLSPLLARLIECEPVQGANLFHGTLIAALAEWADQAAQTHGVNTVLLSGGCFLNQILRDGLTLALKQRSLDPKLPQHLPANDGGLSLGQAWVAALTPLPTP